MMQNADSWYMLYMLTAGSEDSEPAADTDNYGLLDSDGW
jgi:hypothetical protein